MAGDEGPGRSIDKGAEDASPPTGGERPIFVISQDTIRSVAGTDDDASLITLFKILWQGKWIVGAFVAVFGTLSILYALTATEWYRAEVLLAPANEDASRGLAGSLGNVGGLASLAGINLDGSRSVEPVAVLKSRDFVRKFIEDNDLLPVLLSQLGDEDVDGWKGENPEASLDIRDGVKYFIENVRTVIEDPQTGLVTLTVEWTDPEVAATWAGDLAARLNSHLRRRALEEAQRNVEYLQNQLSTTTIATLRESIGHLLESELQKLMLARGNEEFAFRVIDSAHVPKEISSPKRALIVALSICIGTFFGMITVFVRHGLRIQRAQSGTEKPR
jgi:uncharacterized protein involved in exopolysaccharide biosynthesis